MTTVVARYKGIWVCPCRVLLMSLDNKLRQYSCHHRLVHRFSKDSGWGTKKNCRQQLTDRRPQFLDESCNLIWISFHLLWSNLPFGVVPVFHLKGSEAQHHSLSFEIQAKRQGLPPYRAHSVFLFFFVSSHQAMNDLPFYSDLLPIYELIISCHLWILGVSSHFF